MLFYLNNFIAIWLFPPGVNLLLALSGLLAWRFCGAKLGKSLIIFSLLSLWLFSIPFTAQRLIDHLQNSYPHLSPEKLKFSNHTAIVVLEAGLNLKIPEYGKPTVSENTLARLRYAAFLHQKTGIPILVSGNDPTHPAIDQTDYMAEGLKEYFNVPTKWKENGGYNTAQEAILSAKILKSEGINKIYLVTHAFHMARSIDVFRKAGFTVIPAPTAYLTLEYHLGNLSSFLPSAKALEVSVIALHEYIGILWYRLYY